MFYSNLFAVRWIYLQILSLEQAHGELNRTASDDQNLPDLITFFKTKLEEVFYHFLTIRQRHRKGRFSFESMMKLSIFHSTLSDTGNFGENQKHAFALIQRCFKAMFWWWKGQDFTSRTKNVGKSCPCDNSPLVSFGELDIYDNICTVLSETKWNELRITAEQLLNFTFHDVKRMHSDFGHNFNSVYTRLNSQHNVWLYSWKLASKPVHFFGGVTFRVLTILY